jgi:hypothetical protein
VEYFPKVLRLSSNKGSPYISALIRLSRSSSNSATNSSVLPFLKRSMVKLRGLLKPEL